jgi:hypothetical protein
LRETVVGDHGVNGGCLLLRRRRALPTQQRLGLNLSVLPCLPPDPEGVRAPLEGARARLHARAGHLHLPARHGCRLMLRGQALANGEEGTGKKQRATSLSTVRSASKMSSVASWITRVNRCASALKSMPAEAAAVYEFWFGSRDWADGKTTEKEAADALCQTQFRVCGGRKGGGQKRGRDGRNGSGCTQTHAPCTDLGERKRKKKEKWRTGITLPFCCLSLGAASVALNRSLSLHPFSLMHSSSCFSREDDVVQLGRRVRH